MTNEEFKEIAKEAISDMMQFQFEDIWDRIFDTDEEGYDEAWEEAEEEYKCRIDENSWFDEITKEEYEEEAE